MICKDVWISIFSIQVNEDKRRFQGTSAQIRTTPKDRVSGGGCDHMKPLAACHGEIDEMHTIEAA